MSKESSTPILDGVCAFLALASIVTRKKRPTRKITRSTRQTYDAKRGKIITLENESTTYTEQL